MSLISKSMRFLRRSGKLSTKPLIISAGMPRSGSTLLFNIIREILLTKWPNGVSSGWCGDFDQFPKGDVYLVKTHVITPYFRLRSQSIFYTYRDIRVAAISAMRMFNSNQPNIHTFRNTIAQYSLAKKVSNMTIKYEELIHDPHSHVQQIAQILKIDVDTEEIVSKACNLQPPNEYSTETQLHKNHFTNTKDDEWRTLFSEKFQKEINKEFSWWFDECDYPRD